MLSRGNAVARLRNSISPPHWPGRSFHTGYCSFRRPYTVQTNKAAERVFSPTSRAPSFLTTSRSFHESLQQYLSRTNGIQEEALILESRFPRKTALAVLILFGLFMYYGESDMASWVARVEQSYIEEGNDEATPIHFYKDKETLERKTEWLRMRDGLDIRDPRLSAEEVQNVTKEFNNFVDGWVTGEKVSKELNLPTTHGCRFMSNSPCEDYHALGTSPGPGTKPWNYWAVMDGHAGRHTAATLQWWLLPHISSNLCALPSSCSAFEIESTIKKSFLQLDDKIMNAAQMASKWYPVAHFKAIDALAPAISGSCALLAAFDPSSSVLRVACTGDSRAVLGRWDPDTSSYTTITLSEDQTGFNPKEVARLAAEHPDEPDIIDPKTGRLLGIAVTRAFGDHRWKWDNDLVKEVQYRFFGTAPRPGNKTPPYMTAEPEVTETRIVRADAAEHHAGSKRSDFMIMASDGLWDRISSDHAVECVARWLDARDRGKGKVSNDPHLRDRPPVYSLRPDDGVTVDVEQGNEVDWKATPEYFAIEDDNAATCLVRNAMGGTRLGLFFALLAIPRPWSRYAVDDTTVMVVFFDKVGDAK